MHKTQLKRIGFTKNVQGKSASGVYIEIFLHKGKGCYYCRTGTSRQHLRVYELHLASSISEAIQEVERITHHRFESKIEPYVKES